MSAGAILLPSHQQVLGLYKNLIRYGNQLKLTDKKFVLRRIRKEFREHKSLTESKAIEFNYQVNL